MSKLFEPWRIPVVLTGLAALLALSACGGATTPQGGETPDQRSGDSTVSVELKEYAISPSPAAGSPGEVTFEIENTGTETHEFVILATDLGIVDLPTAADGSVDEEAAGMKVVDEVEDIPAGEKRTLKVTLGPSKYVLICNVVEEEAGKTDVHYQLGMRVGFVVK